MKVSTQSAATDPRTGTIDMDMIATGRTAMDRDVVLQVTAELRLELGFGLGLGLQLGLRLVYGLGLGIGSDSLFLCLTQSLTITLTLIITPTVTLPFRLLFAARANQRLTISQIRQIVSSQNRDNGNGTNSSLANVSMAEVIEAVKEIEGEGIVAYTGATQTVIIRGGR
jgi:hypothetical protein